MRNYVVVVLICFGLTRLMGQQGGVNNLYFRHITQKDGLRFNRVKTFLQDRKNFWWIGGRALERYDGYRFKVYFTGNENLNVSSLAEDATGRIWAGTERGLYRLNTATDRFELVAHQLLVKGRPQVLTVEGLLFDESGDLWIAAGRFYARLKNGGQQVEEVSALLGLHEGGDAYYFTLDNRGRLWIQSSSTFGISCYDTRKKVLYNHNHHPPEEKVFDLPLRTMYTLYDGNGTYWMHDGFITKNIYRYSVSENKLYSTSLHVTHFPLGGTLVPGKMFVDDKGYFWLQIQERAGVARYDAANDVFEYLVTSGEKENALWDSYYPSNSSGDIYQDRQGNFWYAGEGVSIFSPYKQKFYQAAFPPAKNAAAAPRSYANGLVWMNDSSYYVSYYGGGLIRFDQHLRPIARVPLPPDAGLNLWSLFTGDGETLYFNGQNGRFFSMNVRTQKCSSFSDSSFGNMLVSAFLVEDSEKIWLGHWSRGLSLFNPIKKNIRHFPFRIRGDSALPIQVLSILPQGEDLLWLAIQRNGLHLFSKKAQKIIYSWYYNNDSSAVSKTNVLHDARWIDDHNILISSWQGLLIFNTRTRTGTRLTMDNGLPDNTCLGLQVEPDRQTAWVNTLGKGVCRISLKDLTVTTYSEEEGNRSNAGEVFGTRLRNGQLLFANTAGFTYFDPQQVHRDPANDSLFITEFYVNGLPRMPDSMHSLQLHHWQNNIRICLSTLDLWNAPGTRYFVRKLPDSAWQLVNDRSQIEFLSLAPGKYVLEFSAARDQRPGIQPLATVSFYIIPPFYRRQWFYVLIVGLLITAGFIFLRVRINSIRKQASYRQRLSETEMAALKAQMNPHFIFNCINSIDSFIQSNDKYHATIYLNKFAKLIRNILEGSKENTVLFSQDIDTLKLYVELEELRSAHKFKVIWQVDDALLQGDYAVPPLIVQPFVENAIIHGLRNMETGMGELHITIQKSEGYIRYEITDNGIGRKAAGMLNTGQTRSFGVQMSRNRVKLFNNESSPLVEISDLFPGAPNPGTRVLVHLKID